MRPDVARGPTAGATARRPQAGRSGVAIEEGRRPEATAQVGGPVRPAAQEGEGEQDVVPPLAQLKVLRALQAELNQQTAEFAQAHPEPIN